MGVGITYSSAIEPLLKLQPALIDFIEVEPQTVWTEIRGKSSIIRIPEGILEHLAGLPGRKLVHSIGAPVGGTVRPKETQLTLLQQTVAYLNSPWVSEHLSFNSTPDFSTGFFLPPRQTRQGVITAVQSIQDLKAALRVPIAIETGVNYLRPRFDEISDGAFVAAVADSADCGILLDLHNIYTNEKNGRQSIVAFLSNLPLDRVWEIHLAGGFEMDGYWLDAHSGAIPDPLFEISKDIISNLPNVKAITFEIFPSFVPVTGLETIRTQMERLHELWELRPISHTEKPTAAIPSRGTIELSDPSPSVAEWERALGALVIGRQPQGDLECRLVSDPGIGLVNRLVGEFRASMIVTVLRLTSRLLMLTLGADIFRTILEDFWSKTAPQPFASSESETFAEYLEALDLQVPHLKKVLEFERAVLSTLLDGTSRVVTFSSDPFPLLRALAEGHLPEVPSQLGSFEIEITPNAQDGLESMNQDTFSKVSQYH